MRDKGEGLGFTRHLILSVLMILQVSEWLF